MQAFPGFGLVFVVSIQTETAHWDLLSFTVICCRDNSGITACAHCWLPEQVLRQLFGINSCALLCWRAAQVRLAFVDMLAAWLEVLPERGDFQGRLLPYVLAALGDASLAVAGGARSVLERLGALYSTEHAADERVGSRRCHWLSSPFAVLSHA